MRQVVTFVGRHWLTLGLLLGSLLLVIWIVRTQRAPGAMTVLEAQGMDMTTARPPEGAQPVEVEEVGARQVGGTSEFPATVAALTDEDVVARVAGRLSRVLVYPGDRVRSGQLVATLDAKELGAQAEQAELMAGSKVHMALGSAHDIEERKAMLKRSKAALKSAVAEQARAQAESEAAQAEKRQAEAQSAAASADVRQMQAELRYANQELDRERRLYAGGAVSLEELQAAKRDEDSAEAKVRAAESQAQAAAAMAVAAAKKTRAASAMATGAGSTIAQAQADIAATATDLEKAFHEQDMARLEAKSYAAGASADSVTAGYRNLFAQTAGVVSERTVSPGTAVMPGQIVLRIKAVDTVRIQAALPQSLFGVVKEGTPVSVVVGDHKWPATVGSVFPLVDDSSRTFQVECRLTNRAGILAPGMYAKLVVQTGSPKAGLAVHTSAVFTDAGGVHYVWVVREKPGGKATDWTCTMHPQVSEPGPGKCPICGMALVPRSRSGQFEAEKRTVETGQSDGSYTEIISGLQAGDKVIWSGHENLQPGMAVAPGEPRADRRKGSGAETQGPVGLRAPSRSPQEGCLLAELARGAILGQVHGGSAQTKGGVQCNRGSHDCRSDDRRRNQMSQRPLSLSGLTRRRACASDAYFRDHGGVGSRLVRRAVLSKDLQIALDRVAYVRLSLGDSLALTHAARQLGHVRDVALVVRVEGEDDLELHVPIMAEGLRPSLWGRAA
jgi:multidrug efflux pump subunit AcrA (membrane-fusion protein)